MLEFSLTIVFIYVFYYIWIIINYDKNGNIKERKNKSKIKNKKVKKMPAEVEYFIIKYKVNLDKINYRYFLQLVGLVVAFDVTIVVTIIDFINILWIKIVLGFVLTIVISLLSFKMLGNYFNKKGLTLNENDKRNRK